MKIVKTVGLDIKGSLDADIVGERIVDCCEAMSAETNVLNLVKVYFDNMPAHAISDVVRTLGKHMTTQGFTNVVFVPIDGHIIKDIQVDHIEVKYV